MHKVKNFVNVGADEDPEVFIDEVIARIEEEEWLNSAREYAAKHTDTQRQADRLVQEIVIRHDPFEKPWVLEKMPLVEPEVDHQQIGEHRVEISDDGEYAKIRIQIRAVGELNPDGTVNLGWLIYKEMEVHKQFWDAFRGAIVYAGGVDDSLLKEKETDEHVDDLILS
jgi:hypothetical protein